MPKWNEITVTDKYKSLPPQAQAEVKTEWFKANLLPELEKRDSLREMGADKVYEWFMQQPDDTGEGIVRSTLGSAIRGAGEIVPGTLQGVGALTGITPISDLGESARAGLEYVAPVNPIYEQGIPAKVANVAGNVASIIGTSGVGGLAGKVLGAERAAAAGSAAARQALTNQAIQAGAKSALYGTGFAQGAAAKAEENKRLGITGAEGYLNLLGGGVSELAPEMLPFGTALESAAARRLLGGVDDAAGRVIPGIRMSAAQEAAEGGSTQVLSNLSTQLTAPTGVEAPGLFEGAGEAALWEGVGGAMFGAINKLGRTPPENQTDEQRAYAAELGAVPVDSSPPITPEESLENFNQGGIPVVSPDGVVTTLPFNREDIRATDLPFNREDIRASELPFTREDIRPTQLPFNREDIRSTELPFSRQNIRGLSQLGQPAISPGITAAVNTADSIVTTAENTSSDVSQATTAARNIIQGVVDTPQPREAPTELPAVTPSPAMEQTENLSQTITDSNGEIAPEMSVLPPTAEAGAGVGEAIAEDGQLEPSTSIEDQKEALKDIIALKKGRGQDVAELESKLQSLGADTIPDFVEVNPETPLHPFTSEKPLLPIKVEVSDAGVRSIDSSVKQIEKLRKSLNGKLARASGANKFSIESDIYAADKALQELGRVGREIESYLKPITPQGTPTPATEGTVMPRGSAIERDVTKPEQMTPEEFIPVGNPVNLGIFKSKKEASARLTELEDSISKSPQMLGILSEFNLIPGDAYQVAKDARGRWTVGATHKHRIALASRENRPVSAAAVDAYKITLPEGYVRQGDLYVFSPQGTPTPATEGKVTPGGVAIERETDEQKFQRIKSMSPSQRTDEDIAFANAFSKRQKELKPQAGEATRKAFLANHTASIGGGLRKALDQTITFRGLKGTVGSWAETLYNEGWRMALDARGNRQFTNGTEALGSSGLGKVGMNYADFLSSQPQTTTVAAPTETAAPSAKEAAVASVVQQPVEGSIPTVEQESAITAIESTEKADVSKEAMRFLEADLTDAQRAKWTPEMFAAAQAFFDSGGKDFDSLKKAIKFQRVVQQAYLKADKEAAAEQTRRKAADAALASEVEKAEKEQAKLEADQKKRDELGLKTLNSLIEKTRTNVVQGTVKSSDANQAVAILNKSGAIPNVLFTWIGTSKDFLADPANRARYPETWKAVSSNPNIEGMSENKQPIVFTDNVGVSDLDQNLAKLQGTTPEVAAVRRVILHENIHKGMFFLSLKDKMKLFQFLHRLYSPEELDQLAKSYDEYSDWRINQVSYFSIIEEAMTRYFDSMAEIPRDGIWAEFMQFLRDIWQKITGKTSEPTLKNYKDVFRLIRNSLKNSEAANADRLKNGGEVRMSMSEFISNVTPEQDAAYAKAVADGDMETAQRMVDEAAKAAGFNTGPVYHSTNADFNEFSRDFLGSGGPQRIGFWFSSAKHQHRGGRFVSVYLNLANPLEVSRSDPNYPRISDGKAGDKFLAMLRERGFDGITTGSNYAVINPNQIKSADPVTYDEAGNVIPLSRRFQSASNDIRFSKVEYDSPNEAAFNSGAEVARNADYDERDKAVRSTIRAAYDLAPKDNGPSVPLDQLFDIAKQSMTDLTEGEFSQILQDLYEDSGALLQAGESPFIVTTSDGQRAGSAIIVSSLPTGAMASIVDSPATNEFTQSVDDINNGTAKAAFSGRQFKDFKPIDRTVKSAEEYSDVAIKYVNNLEKEGVSLEDIANSVISPVFLESIGIEQDLMAQDALTIEVRQRVDNASRKEKSPGRKKQLSKLSERLSAFWQGVGSKKGQHLGQRRYLVNKARYSWMFIRELAEKAMKEARTNILISNFGSENATSFTQNSYADSDKANQQSVDENINAAEEAQEFDQDAADLAAGEATLTGAFLKLYEELKDLLRELGILARLDTQENITAKASITPARRNELATLSKDERAKLREKNLKRVGEILNTLLGKESDANTPEKKTVRKKREKMVEVAKKRADKGQPIDPAETANDIAIRLLNEFENKLAQSAFFNSATKPDTIVKAFREQISDPMDRKAFKDRLMAMEVTSEMADRLFDKAARTKDNAQWKRAQDMLEGPNALRNIIREINRARPGDQAPLSKQIPWRELLSQNAKTVEEYRQRIFDAISANEELKSATPDQKSRLADLFAEAWEANRTRILDGMLERMIRAEEAKKNLSKEGAKALQEQRMRIVEDINLGIFDNDELAKRMAEKFGIKSEFTEMEREKINSLIEVLQDEGLNAVKRQVAAYKLLEVLQGELKIPVAKMLADFWVSSVLSGPNTIVSIGLAVASGAFELSTALSRVFIAGFTNQKQLPSELAGAYKTLARLLSAFGRQANIAWQYLVTGDPAFLDPSMNDVTENMQWGNIGKSNKLAEQMAKSDKILAKSAGLFMRTVSRLLTALDVFNSGLTKEGSLSIVFRQIGLDPEKIAALEKKSDLKPYKDAIIQKDFGGTPPKSARDKAIVDSYALSDMMAELDKLGNVSENANFFGQQGAMTLDPSGLGGVGYRAIRSLVTNFESGSDRFLKKAQRGWSDSAQNGDQILSGLELAFAYALQFLAYNAANFGGVRFARFAGNKFNQGLSFIPGIGFARAFEAEFDPDRIRAKEAFIDSIQRNQLVGVILSIGGYYILKAIADEPDDEKRGWFINGGWGNLTPEKKQQKLAAGEKEYTIGINGKVFNYANWPISSALAAIGSLSDLIRFSPDQWNDKNVTQIMASAAMSGAAAAADIPALSQFQELFGNSLSSKDPNEKRMERFAKVMSSYAGGFVPRFLKDIDYAQDPSLRKYETLWEKTASHIPVYRRYEGKEYYDILGQQIQRNIYPGSREFMTKPTDPAYKVLGALNSRGIWLTPANAEHRMVGKGARRRSLTQEEADNYSLETGKGYKQMLLRYGQRALQMPTERAKAFLLDKADDVRDRALKKVYRGYTPAS